MLCYASYAVRYVMLLLLRYVTSCYYVLLCYVTLLCYVFSSQSHARETKSCLTNELQPSIPNCGPTNIFPNTTWPYDASLGKSRFLLVNELYIPTVSMYYTFTRELQWRLFPTRTLKLSKTFHVSGTWIKICTVWIKCQHESVLMVDSLFRLAI